MEKPFFPTWNLKKLYFIFDTLLIHNKFIINGVTGSGKTTLVNNKAKIISGSPKRIIKLQCVENMEIEYHKRWVGYYDKGKFYPGKLLGMLEKAKQDPSNNYVFILDDLDKIPPVTFFGSELWQLLDSESGSTTIDGYNKTISLTKNFFLISVTHQSINSIYSFSDEQIRRLGKFWDIKPDYEELLLSILRTFFQ